MQPHGGDVPILEWWKRRFKKRHIVAIGDLGIYHNVASFDTLNDNNHGLTYDIYAKIRAVEIYDSLVEVEVVSIKISDSVSQDIINLITNNFPKYLDPKKVKWQIKPSEK